MCGIDDIWWCQLFADLFYSRILISPAVSSMYPALCGSEIWASKGSRHKIAQANFSSKLGTRLLFDSRSAWFETDDLQILVGFTQSLIDRDSPYSRVVRLKSQSGLHLFACTIYPHLALNKTRRVRIQFYTDWCSLFACFCLNSSLSLSLYVFMFFPAHCV